MDYHCPLGTLGLELLTNTAAHSISCHVSLVCLLCGETSGVNCSHCTSGGSSTALILGGGNQGESIVCHLPFLCQGPYF